MRWILRTFNTNIVLIYDYLFNVNSKFMIIPFWIHIETQLSISHLFSTCMTKLYSKRNVLKSCYLWMSYWNQSELIEHGYEKAKFLKLKFSFSTKMASIVYLVLCPLLFSSQSFALVYRNLGNKKYCLSNTFWKYLNQFCSTEYPKSLYFAKDYGKVVIFSIKFYSLTQNWYFCW